MISLPEARACIAGRLTPLPSARTPLRALLGRVLREDISTAEDIPAFDRAAMDGYAFAADDPAVRFRIIGEVQAGAGPAIRVPPGECVRIFTGAALPEGATQVLMQEDARRDGEWMTPTRRPTVTHIRRRGEDARAGSVLLAAGTRVGPTELALLAQLGAVEPQVTRPVRVVHLTTGNELVDPAQTPAPGQIRDTNSALIAGLLAERGATLLDQARCGDSLDALVAAVEAAGHSGGSEPSPGAWDLLLISGGASVGDYDFGARALERLGFELHFRQLNLRPGKPLIFGTRDRQAAFVIPGNPVSHFVTFHVAIAAALEALEGAAASWPLVRLSLAREIADAPNPRETWWPARLAVAGGELRVEPLAWQSSGDLCGLAGAKALIRVPPGNPPSPAGHAVECLLLPA